MTVSKFIKKKNKILKKYIGLPFNLVPKKQIKECKQVELSTLNPVNSCPYCMAYLRPNGNCEGCPMAEAFNKCELDTENTYTEYVNWTDSKGIPRHFMEESPAHKPLAKLIAKYNSEL